LPKFTLEIKLGNESMQTTGDISFALYELAAKFTHQWPLSDKFLSDAGGVIRDTNGNTVGSWGISE
jgi:hypothetical protein